MRALALAALATTLLASCAPKKAEGGGYRNVSVADLKTAVDSGAFVLDVRTEAESAGGHIAGSTLLPLDQVVARSSELDPAKTIYVICRSGNRSAQASDLLVKAGFKDIRNVTGGMNEWQAAGYPVTR